MAYMGEPQNRQGIVLLTDGIDTQSIVSMNQMIMNIRAMHVPIYAIGFAYDIRKNKAVPDDYSKPSVLRTIAEETGGAYYELTEESELQEVLDTILNELRYQYLIGYRSNQEAERGSYHAIRLQPRNGNVTVKVRKGYYVSK